MKRETSSICEENSFHKEEIISTILVEDVNHFSTMQDKKLWVSAKKAML